MSNDMSETMSKAYWHSVNFCHNVLVRFPGGMNTPVRWMRHDQTGESFGTSTIEALVKRKKAFYSKWQEGRRGKFPIEVTMITIDGM